MIRDGRYMHAGLAGSSVVQFKLTVDPLSGLTQYSSRTYANGFAPVTGLGIASDIKSLMVFSDPTGGVARQEVVTKLPVCEDITP
jgi:hypothetical protein